jgi:hypothetical protein
MVQRTIARMYDSYDHARTVVTDLEAAGIPQGDISLVANEKGRNGATTASDSVMTTETATGAGAVVGTLVGGGVGLLTGIGALAIPGVGPVVAAGLLVATLTGAGIGAASGGLVGALTGAGVSREEADVYAEGVRGGSSLVTVRVNEADAARIEDVMGRHGPVDWQQRRAAYGSDWAGFDETSGSKVRNYRDAPEADVRAAGTGGAYDTSRRL